MTKGYRRPIKLWQSAIFKTLSDSKKIYPAQAPDFRVLYGKYGTPGGLRRGISFGAEWNLLLSFLLPETIFFLLGPPLVFFAFYREFQLSDSTYRAVFNVYLYGVTGAVDEFSDNKVEKYG